MASRKRKVPHSFVTRAAYSLSMIIGIVLIGTVGIHTIEGLPYVDAFYFTSMLATGEGPTYTPTTDLGKEFASVLAFVSVGTVLTALIFVFGPFFGRVLRAGAERVEEVERELERRPRSETHR